MQSLCTQPLSPVATQHSLPSGRYALPGPDFTGWIASVCGWRTYSITSSRRAANAGGTERPSAFAILRLIARSYTGSAAALASRRALLPYQLKPELLRAVPRNAGNLVASENWRDSFSHDRWCAEPSSQRSEIVAEASSVMVEALAARARRLRRR